MKSKTIETKVSIYSFDELDNAKQQLINKAKEQVNKAYAPYSEFHVGAAIELENGEIFAGSNQENSAYPSGLCAQPTVAIQKWMNGFKLIMRNANFNKWWCMQFIIIQKLFKITHQI